MDIQSLFPLEGEITQEIINSANTMDINNCIGALTLKAALGNNIGEGRVVWGNTFGEIHLEASTMYINTKERLLFMSVKTPQKVKFILTEILN